MNIYIYIYISIYIYIYILMSVPKIPEEEGKNGPKCQPPN